MKPEFYGAAGRTSYFQDVTPPLDVAAVALYSSLTDHYHFFDGVVLGTYSFHAGHFTINSLSLAETIGLPATDRLLINLVKAAQSDAAPLTDAPAGLDVELDHLGLAVPIATGTAQH